MKNDNKTAVATKEDVSLIMDSIGNLYDANESWKDEILDKNEKWKEEIKNHFGVMLEAYRHDLARAKFLRSSMHQL
ncbi:MAG: hypothetical protein O2904_02560 [bacterium]|nr:hypothetical protein [bacterium]